MAETAASQEGSAVELCQPEDVRVNNGSNNCINCLRSSASEWEIMNWQVHVGAAGGLTDLVSWSISGPRLEEGGPELGSVDECLKVDRSDLTGREPLKPEDFGGRRGGWAMKAEDTVI